MSRVGWASALFVTAEALGWYIALRAAGALVERDVLVPLEEDLLRLSRGDSVPEPAALARALGEVQGALDASFGGPSLPVVLAGAGGAYLLGRWLTRSRLDPPLRAALALLISLPVLQLLVHAGITGDLWVWQGEGLERITGGASDPRSVQQFIADPDISAITGNSATVTVVGLFALWVRFLLAGRGEVTFETALRSFTIGFVAAVVGGLLAITAGADRVAALALPQFALAAASLAVAHANRADLRAAGRAGTHAGGSGGGPWAWSLGGTLAALLGIALVFSLVALLDVQRLFEPPVALLGDLIEWVLLLVIRPVFWVVNGVLGFIIDLIEGDVTPPTAPAEEGAGEGGNDASVANRQIPGWVVRGAQAALVVGLLWFSYRFVLGALTRRVAGERARPAEERAQREGGAGTGSLLRRLLRRTPGRETLDGRWVSRHGAYALFAQSVAAARARGFEPRPGETPLRFAAEASGAFDAPFLRAVGEQFDAARYGRRPEDAAELRRLGEALRSWERETPPTDDLRQRVRRRPAASERDPAGDSAGGTSGGTAAAESDTHHPPPAEG